MDATCSFSTPAELQENAAGQELYLAQTMANATCCECAAGAVEDATEQGSVAFAFAMSFGAGMCTCIGGAMSFYGKLEDKRILAISLAVSAGVMLYVSFVEIFVKALGGFTDQFTLDGKENPERDAYFAATGFFFVGIGLTRMINVVLAKVQEKAAEESIVGAEGACECQTDHVKGDHTKGAGYAADATSTTSTVLLATSGKGAAPQLLDAQNMMAKLGKDADGSLNMEELGELIKEVNISLSTVGNDDTRSAERTATADAKLRIDAAEAKKLQQMGMFTALSIFIHNFPEGLATFIATLADPAAGAALAVAIGIHNIPEGICVGFPIYYATGNKWKAFGVAFLSGISEPIGGFVGWLVMVALSGGQDISPLAYGIMFGIVGGMMVYIVLAELLPSAHRYDPEDRYVTLCVMGGMAVMASSLVLFVA